MPKQSHLASVKTTEPEDEPAALREPVTQPDLDAMESFIAEASKAEAPMVQRRATHLDRFDMATKELQRERDDLIARRDLLRRQAESVEAGLTLHIDDIDATLALYQGGTNSLPQPKD